MNRLIEIKTFSGIITANILAPDEFQGVKIFNAASNLLSFRMRTSKLNEAPLAWSPFPPRSGPRSGSFECL